MNALGASEFSRLFLGTGNPRPLINLIYDDDELKRQCPIVGRARAIPISLAPIILRRLAERSGLPAGVAVVQRVTADGTVTNA